MGNVQYWQAYDALLVVLPGPAYVYTFPPVTPGQTFLVDHVMLMEETTAITAMQVRKAIGADTPVLWEQRNPLVGRWYEIGTVLHVNENESLQLVYIGAIVMDVLDFFAQGRIISSSWWEIGHVE